MRLSAKSSLAEVRQPNDWTEANLPDAEADHPSRPGPWMTLGTGALNVSFALQSPNAVCGPSELPVRRAPRYASRMKHPTIIVTSGLPGSGKSTLAEGIGRLSRVPVFSIDPTEAAMWVSGLPKESTGIAAYRVVEAIAAENLKLGLSVIVDAVNPVEEARQMWRDLGTLFRAPVCFIECFCSDDQIHKTRIEKRVRSIAGMPEITWEQVQERKAEYQDWHDVRLRLDTASEAPEILIVRAMDYLQTI